MNTPGATHEVHFESTNGYIPLVFAFVALLCLPLAAVLRFPPLLVIAIIAFLFIAKGMYMLQPNQAALLLLFGATAAPTRHGPALGQSVLRARPRSRCARTTSTARS